MSLYGDVKSCLSFFSVLTNVMHATVDGETNNDEPHLLRKKINGEYLQWQNVLSMENGGVFLGLEGGVLIRCEWGWINSLTSCHHGLDRVIACL
jgi:hypothetical protein